MERLIIDRIEESIAVCEREDLSHTEINVSLLPAGAREGSVILRHDSGEFSLDEKATADKKSAILQKQRSVFRKPSGEA